MRHARFGVESRVAPHLSAIMSTLLAALSGLLYGIAAPGIGLWPVALLCWAPFLVALRRSAPRKAAWLGLVQGLATGVTATSWMLTAVKTLTGWGWGLSLAGTAVLWLLQSGRSAVLGWLVARAAQRGWPLGASFGCALAAVEVAYPMLFGWQGAIHVHGIPLLMQAADIGGPILVSLLLAGGSVAVAELVLAVAERRRLDGLRLALALACPALLAVYGAYRQTTIERQIAEAPKGRLGVVQGNVGYQTAAPGVHLSRHLRPTEEMVAKERLDLVVWPETALHTVYEAAGLSETLRRNLFGAGASFRATPVLTGVNVKDPTAQGNSSTNSAVLVDPIAGVTGRYDKDRLVPFGEYVPLGDFWPALYKWFPRSGPVARGGRPAPLLLGQHRIATLICYEDILQGYANGVVRDTRPDLLVNMTNDVWFGRSNASAMHFALAKFRAVEHRRFLVRAGNTGVSAIVDPLGRITAQAPQFTQATLVGEVAWMKEGTFYEGVGDAPWWACVALAALMACVRTRRCEPSLQTSCEIPLERFQGPLRSRASPTSS